MPETNEGLSELLSWAGILVPIVLVFVAAMCRSLAKGNNFFSWENLYLGIDLTFAALAAELVEILEVLRQHAENPKNDTEFLSRVLIGILGAFVISIALLAVTKLHQKWDCPCPPVEGMSVHAAKAARDKRAKLHKKKQIQWLGFASNGIGFATIVAFAWLRARKIV